MLASPSDPLPAPLPAPGDVLNGADMRVQETIHGHRFIADQEPYMLVLEALAVCAATPLGSVTAGENAHETFHYDLPHRRKMRFLLFQDRHLESVFKDDSIPDATKWGAWKERVNDQFDPDRRGHDHFSYLDETFECRIESVLQAVRLLRSMELDVMHNRRWTSRFLALRGPHMICPDMREGPNGAWHADRRFFGRGGELVYLMLNRSSLAGEVGTLVQERLLNAKDPMNVIAKALCDPKDDKKSSTHIGYLPFREYPAYDRLAEDWKGILSLNRLPNGHLFEPLFRMTGLNLAVYLAERARDEIGAPRAEPIIADLTDGADKQLRQSSKEHLNRHRQSANRAVQAFVERHVGLDEGWATAVAQGDRSAATKALQRLFGYASRDKKPPAPAKQLDSFLTQAMGREKNNAYKYLLPLVKGIGLAATRQRIGSWFCLDDAMIRALVMSNVSRTIPLQDFVARLYERYGLVIGPAEARRAFDRPPVGAQSFEANLAALETRMTRLALTRRLSDDCAFITNPYRSGHD